MAVAVVFAFAVADGLLPVVGAAPYDVLARQLPRLLVARLNAGGDRGIRFFPFVGPVDGQRNFLNLREQFEPAQLALLHKQGATQLLVDGIFRPGGLHWRVLDGESLKVQIEGCVPFDARKPLDVLVRLEFEITGLLGWMGRPQPAHPLSGEALGWFLVLKDSLLRREANLPEASPDPLRPLRRCLELARDDEGVRALALDYAVQLLKRGEHREGLAPVLADLAQSPSLPTEQLERLAVLLHAAGDDAAAATAIGRAAMQSPERPELVERAAAQLFRLERYGEVRGLVELARHRGVASVPALAQLAAVCDRTGDQALRVQLTEELLGMDDLPVPVARLLVSFLIEDDRPLEACQVAERALAKDPAQPMLQFELGRAYLLLDNGSRASEALQQALQRGLPPTIAPQAQRYLRLAAVPGLWSGTQRVENAIAAGDLAEAMAGARELVRTVGRAAETWFLVGLVRHKLGHDRRAERALRRALRIDDRFGDAHNRLGILLVSRGNVEAGHQHLQQAHAIAPQESSPLLHLAQACALLGRIDEARQHIAAAELRGADPQMVEAVRREILAPRG
ncbi:MAG: tetratricopeptide repeat protein [Planctomycetes bacterium]|nr:tetratricopeptide repeat protein [Planctomycetota bacterium]